MNSTQDITVERGETLSIGNSQYYTGTKPTATLVTVNGAETFLEINGTLYSQCGYCDKYGTKTYHRNVLDGVCFQCGGRGYDREVGSVEQAAKRIHNRELRQARAARKAAEKAAAARAEGDAWRAANTDLADMLDAIYAELAEANTDYLSYEAQQALEAKWSDFVLNMANTVGMGRPLTAKQATDVTDAISEALDRQAAKQAREDASRWYGAEGDKVAGATGTVKVSMTIEANDQYSYTGTTFKRLVIIEGTGEFTGVTFKIFGTGKTLWDTERDQAVEVKGAVKKHGERDGIKQTELTRATIKVVAE